MSRWKTKESNISRRAEVARRNTQLGETRELMMGLVVQWFIGKKKRFVLNMGFDRKPAWLLNDVWVKRGRGELSG